MKDRFIDYYEILEIEFGSSIEDIKKAFRKLAKQYHPDVNNRNEKDFKLILEAYKVLSDPNQKEEYDKIYIKEKIKPFQESIPSYQNSTKFSQNPPFSRQKIQTQPKTQKSFEQHQKTEGKPINIIDHSRVEYKISLVNISKAGFDLSKGFKRKDFLEELGEDMVVYLTDKEVKEGAILSIKLPAKSVCEVCLGQNRNCYRCDGSGYVTTIEEINIPIPPNTKHSETILVNLTEMKRRRGIVQFGLRELKIRVKWLSLSDIDF